MKLKYTQVQIVKHALQHYIERPEANEKDLVKEKNLLAKFTKEADEMKTKYEIN